MLNCSNSLEWVKRTRDQCISIYGNIHILYIRTTVRIESMNAIKSTLKNTTATISVFSHSIKLHVKCVAAHFFECIFWNKQYPFIIRRNITYKWNIRHSSMYARVEWHFGCCCCCCYFILTSNVWWLWDVFWSIFSVRYGQFLYIHEITIVVFKSFVNKCNELMQSHFWPETKTQLYLKATKKLPRKTDNKLIIKMPIIVRFTTLWVNSKASYIQKNTNFTQMQFRFRGPIEMLPSHGEHNSWAYESVTVSGLVSCIWHRQVEPYTKSTM